MELFSALAGLIGGLIAIFGGLCAVVVPLLLIAGLGVFLYRRSQQAKVAKAAAQSWPQTKGTVLTSSVESRRSGNSTSTYPVVVYQYEVKGKTYRNQTISAGDQFLNVRVIGQAQKTVNRYPAGAKVTVYYNPADPGDAVLKNRSISRAGGAGGRRANGIPQPYGN